MGCGADCGALVLQLLVYGLTSGAVVALSAIGFSLTYAVARQINLAHGSMFALTTVVVANLALYAGVTADAPVGVRLLALLGFCLCAAAVGGGLNLAVERLAFRPFRSLRDPLAPLVASIAVSFVFYQLVIWWHDARFVPLPNAHQGVNVPLLAMPDLVPRVELLGGAVSLTLRDVLVVVIGAAVALGGGVWLDRSRGGRLLRATAEDPEATALMGGDPAHASKLAFVVGGLVTGLGAAIYAAYFGGANAQYGLRSGLAAMTAAVLGGVGNPRGALLGGILLGLCAAFSDYFLDAQWTPALVLVLLILLLAFRPRGLLGASAPAGFEGARQAVLTASSEPRFAGRVLAALFVVGAAYPLLDAGFAWFRLPGMTMVLLMVTLAVGLSIVVGFAGLLDLGYAAFFAIGGYTAAMLTSSGSRFAAGWPDPLRSPLLALVAGGVVAAGFGALFGLPSVRTRGEYLAIVTLAFGEIIPLVIWHLPDLTGGPRGMSGIPPVWPGALATYTVALLLAALAGLGALRLRSSRAGRAWGAVGDDEVAAAALGINPPRQKLLAFALGAGYAGVAGAVFGQLFGYVEPAQFDFTLSLMVLGAVVLGGRWGVVGAVVGALGIALYDRFVVESLNLVAHRVGDTLALPALVSLDLRQHNFAIFGLALLLATRARAGRYSIPR